MKRFIPFAALLSACSSEPASPSGAGGSGGAQIVDATIDTLPPTHDAPHFDAVPDVFVPPFDGPKKLSETGLYSDIATRTLAPGIFSFGVRYPLWSDGAEKQRWLLLPEGTQIDTSNMDVWKFPLGTKAWKQFSLGAKLVETRLLEKRAEGWRMVSYVWDEAGGDATAEPYGVTDALGTTLDVPSQEDCTQCHAGAGDVLIGVSAIQLSEETGGGPITELVALGLLSSPPQQGFQVPGDGTLEDAIGYLHGNCGQCHNDQHFLASQRALRLKLTVAATTPESTPVYTTAIGGKTHHVIDGTTISVVPGKPLESQLYVRAARRDLEAMPPVGTELADATGLATLSAWITGLAP